MRDRPVHRWVRGARARRPCAASITPSASPTPAEGLGRARLPALQHPADKSQVGRDAKLEAILDKLVVGTRTSSAKFGPAEFVAAVSEFKLLGVPLEKNWSPNYASLEKMATSVNAKINGMPAPKFPMDATVHPAYLRALVDLRTGNLSVEGGKKLVLD